MFMRIALMAIKQSFCHRLLGEEGIGRSHWIAWERLRIVTSESTRGKVARSVLSAQLVVYTHLVLIPVSRFGNTGTPPQKAVLMRW